MPNRLLNFLRGNERQIECPRICGETCAESLQIGVVLRTGILLGQDKRGRKSYPAARQTAQKTIVPAIGWILSANEIKLAAPAMINEIRQTVVVTARTTTILLALEFWASAAALTWFSLLCTRSSALQSKGDISAAWIARRGVEAAVLAAPELVRRRSAAYQITKFRISAACYRAPS